MSDVIRQFRELRLARRKDEVWRGVDFSTLMPDGLVPAEAAGDGGAERHYPCNMPDLDTLRITLVNGRCLDGWRELAGGLVCGSLRQALERCPDRVAPYLGRCPKSDNPYERLNAEHYLDGAFVFIPAGMRCTTPIQIMSVTDSAQPLFLQTRNLIVADEGSEASLILCDDSYGESRSMANNVTEIFVGPGAQMDCYKLQNMNDQCGLLNQTYATCGTGARMRSIAITLNGGRLRNHTEVRQQGTHCHTEVNGLYLIDKEQFLDNYVFVEHALPECTSRALYKGIVDDSAQAIFNGHVLVSPGAVKTEAYQTNRNILMTDKANVTSKPFLEIYNDDVKCSHGSTTGQLDDVALFYIRSRGISERTARTLLLYAFCDEVLQGIALPALRERLSDMVKKRLHGELTPCAECALHCGTPCNGPEVDFRIDPSKL